MGFNYNLGDDQMRMINKFSKVSKNNETEIDRNLLPLKDQIKWLDEKQAKDANTKSKAATDAKAIKPITRITHKK